ncbi:sensor domain-containing diguanylate cyclase [Pontixanthobacter luteolus]|uniref:sensor domain-containing diguanylate cyclase n=1 Tax=Pontixanthobacter luteolus TaxID=295089 RepID=UPI002303F8D6|nr:sensor domain-containing diguanylate cyclase [Pontixanthobacter luteolus]
MDALRTFYARLPIAAITAGLAYYALAALSLYLTEGVSGLATIWPSSGVFVAALLLSSKPQRPAIVICIALASFVANGQANATWSDAALFTIANVCEALMITWLCLYGRASGQVGNFSNLSSVGRFCGSAIIGTLSAALIAGFLSGKLSVPFVESWATTTLLGTLIVTPLIVTVVRIITSDKVRVTTENLVESFGIAVILIALSAGVFGQTAYPLLFLPLIGVLIATYRLGGVGTAVGVFSVAMAGTLTLAGGAGAVPLIEGGRNAGTLFFQFYLLSLLIAAWPLSALLEQKRRLIANYAESNYFLELAESSAKLGHWHVGSDGAELGWSNEVYQIHGLDADHFRPEKTGAIKQGTSLDLYHEDDRENVRTTLLQALQQQDGFTYNARVVRPDGEVRFITSIGEARFDDRGNFAGLFGTLQDITAQTEILEELRQARESALREAENSMRLAETDQLTGIANRRKAMMVLADAIKVAEAEGLQLAVGILDVDHFKSINDRFGHAVGDHVLQQVASLCSSALREEDFVGRLGGEEFLIVMPGAAPEIAKLICERVRIAIQLADWTGEELDLVTVSIGIASHRDGADDTWLMQAADAALYQAKSDGRNLLRLAS